CKRLSGEHGLWEMKLSGRCHTCKSPCHLPCIRVVNEGCCTGCPPEGAGGTNDAAANKGKGKSLSQEDESASAISTPAPSSATATPCDPRSAGAGADSSPKSPTGSGGAAKPPSSTLPGKNKNGGQAGQVDTSGVTS
ncbi:unnamed protein product, partial [Ectocarpus sp. 8 AP-2014]